jgi:hypothetical protein
VIRDSLAAPWVPHAEPTALHPKILPEK